jgi:hypothetical protein
MKRYRSLWTDGVALAPEQCQQQVRRDTSPSTVQESDRIEIVLSLPSANGGHLQAGQGRERSMRCSFPPALY